MPRMFQDTFLKLLLVALLFSFGYCAPPLESYGADGSQVSVSGISSGAFMAVQVHVAYSASIIGVGLVDGGPYWCARCNLWYALNSCTSTGDIDVDYLIDPATDYALFTKTIDHYDNMASDKVYIFSGSLDDVVIPAVGMAAEQYYRHYITDNANFKTEYSVRAAHAMITESWGNPCDYSGAPYINNCGYNAAFEMLDHFYGGLTRPTAQTTQNGDLVSFDQNEFFSLNNADMESIADTGYAYIPSGCLVDASHCKVHIALHGCHMHAGGIGLDYVQHAGYNEVAELNDIIIIYPQTTSKMFNPDACWDWWGYASIYYACNLAPQMDFMKQMIDRVTV